MKARSSRRAAIAWTEGKYASGWFHEPTVFVDCDPKMRICQEEIFGPVVSVIPFETFEEGLAVANGVNYGLVGFDLHAQRK